MSKKYYVRGEAVNKDDWIIYEDEELDEYEDECDYVTDEMGRIVGIGREL